MFRASIRQSHSILCNTCFLNRSHWNLSKVNEDCLKLLKYNNYVVGNGDTSSSCEFGLLGKEVLVNWKFEASNFVKDGYNINHIHEIENSLSGSYSITECENVLKQFFKAQHTNRNSQSLKSVTKTRDNLSRIAFHLQASDEKEKNSLLVYGEIVKKNAVEREDKLDQENTTNMEWLRKFIRKSGKLKVGEKAIEAGNTIVYAHDHDDGSVAEPIVLQQLRLVSPPEGISSECKGENDYLLILTIDLTNLARASLLDAMHCVRILDERLWMMRLHRRLVPIKMAVVTEGDAEFRVKQVGFFMQQALSFSLIWICTTLQELLKPFNKILEDIE